MRIGAQIDGSRSIADAVARARQAESLGYDSVWSPQLPNQRDTLTVLAAIAQATERIRLGTAVLPIYQRHPTQMAQAALTLDELSGGRFVLGIGISHKVVVESMWGLRIEDPVEAMREYLTVLRETITTGATNVDGRHFVAHSAYSPPRNEHLPVAIAALGERMLELAGELADGVALWMCSPAYVRDHVVPHVRAGREKAGKTPDGFETTAAVPAAPADDVAKARESFRGVVGRYASLPFYRRVLDAAGFADDLRDGQVTDRVLDELGGIGDRDAVRGILDRYREAGATLAVVGPIASYDKTLEAAVS